MRDNEGDELGMWIRTFVIFIASIFFAVGFFLYLNRHTIFSNAIGANGSLLFTKEQIPSRVGEIIHAQIFLNTNDALVKGTDVRIEFNPSRLELIDITPAAASTSSLKTFTPLRGNVFDKKAVISNANKMGLIEFSAVTADMRKQTITAPFKGMVILAELTLRSIQPGATTLTFIHADYSRDSTIIQDFYPPLNILNKVNTLTITSTGVFEKK